MKGAPSGKTYLHLYLRGVDVATEVPVQAGYRFAQVVTEQVMAVPPPPPRPRPY